MRVAFLTILALFLCPTSYGGAADPLQAALAEQEATDARARASQKQVEDLDDQTRRMLEEYREVQRELDRLRQGNAQRERMIHSQEVESQRIDSERVRLEATHQEVEPLMTRMLKVLERFVALDLPFLPEERKTRVAQLQSLMEGTDAGLAERYRRLLEAYQVELQYGRGVEAYQGELHTGHRVRLVEYLRLGRVALYYLSLKRDAAGIWDPVEGRWVGLDSRYHRDLEQAIRIARQEQPPDLMPLPLFAPRQGAHP